MNFHYALEPSHCTFSERVVERVSVQEPDMVQVVIGHVAVGKHMVVGVVPYADRLADRYHTLLFALLCPVESPRP